MLAVFAALAGVLALLIISEFLGRNNGWRGDPQRQFVHIAAGGFIASWPWFLSWRTIEWLGVAMLLVAFLNYKIKIIDFHSKLNRETNGHIFYALAVICGALITHQKIFFALAILVMAFGDGLANLVGQKYGQKWRYKIFHHTKTIIGSMTMWFVSLVILGIGLLFAQDLISFSDYAILLLILPPLLVLVENTAMLGFDNLLIPLVVLLALGIAK